VLVLSFISWTTPLFPTSPAHAALERVPHEWWRSAFGTNRPQSHSCARTEQHFHSVLCLFRLSCCFVIGRGPSWIGVFLIAAIDPEAQQP
jgi:hypothetical protein